MRYGYRTFFSYAPQSASDSSLHQIPSYEQIYSRKKLPTEMIIAQVGKAKWKLLYRINVSNAKSKYILQMHGASGTLISRSIAAASSHFKYIDSLHFSSVVKHDNFAQAEVKYQREMVDT